MSSYFSYSPGDVAMVAPQNMADTVDDFISYFNINPDQLIHLHQNDQGISTILFIAIMYFLHVLTFIVQ